MAVERTDPSWEWRAMSALADAAMEEAARNVGRRQPMDGHLALLRMQEIEFEHFYGED